MSLRRRKAIRRPYSRRFRACSSAREPAATKARSLQSTRFSSEGDDLTDPIADAVRGILDGHIVLSRTLAETGHFPAIDVLASLSRLMPQLVQKPHVEAASKLRELLGAYRDAKDLIQVGAYEKGSDPRVDTAARMMPTIERFLKQGERERSERAAGVKALFDLVTEATREIPR